MDIFTREKLKKAWQEIYLSKPIKKRIFSRGIDNVSIEDFKKNDLARLSEIHRQLSDGFFVFDKLFHFEKQRKGKPPRIIQAPTIKDRIVQKVLSEYIYDKYFKTEFHNYGIVGSVRGNSLEKIICRILGYYKSGYIYVLKTDIINFFPTISIPRLKKIISYYIKDSELVKLLDEYLKVSTLSGIPQGTPLSPLMANIYLLGLDRYLSSRKKIKHIRYVDDLLIFCKTKQEAERTCRYLNNYFGKVKLEIHPLKENSKTKIDKFDSGNIDVLGVVYKNDKLEIKNDKVLKFHRFLDELSIVNQNRNNYISTQGVVDNKKILELIKCLSYKINGWGGAYLFCDVKELYSRLDKKIDRLMTKFLNDLGYADHNKQSELIKKVTKLSKLKLKRIN